MLGTQRLLNAPDAGLQCPKQRLFPSRVTRGVFKACPQPVLDSPLPPTLQQSSCGLDLWHKQQPKLLTRCSSFHSGSDAVAQVSSSCCHQLPAAAGHSSRAPHRARVSSRSRHRPTSNTAVLVVALDKERNEDFEQPPEAGLLPEVAQRLESNTAASSSIGTSPSSSLLGGSQPTAAGSCNKQSSIQGTGNSSSRSASPSRISNPSAAVAAAGAAVASGTAGSLQQQDFVSPGARTLYPPSERSQIQESWETLMRWSKTFSKRHANSLSPIEAASKVVVFGGGSFGTAMGTSLAVKKAELDVVLLLRDPYLCKDINTQHCNSKYLPDFKLPPNVRATTDAAEAIAGAQYAVHAVPVQHSRAFLSSIKEVLPKAVPIVCVSKGLEVGTGCMMSEVIPSALGRRQPAVFLSGPSFAKEVMQGRPTGVVAASKDAALAREIQELFASPSMRVNTSTDVTGVEICGALKNVLAIAAGIVEGLELGHNALAALIAQGCAEIRWLSQKVGAKPATISGLSGLGDIMLTCYGDLSRNRSVGVRLGRGEKLHDILASSSQVAEGVATAGVVVSLARKYRVSLPVLTAVAQVLDNNLEPAEAVRAVMNLPQIEER